MSDTIYALATAQGRAGIAVVRISGTRAWPAAQVLAGSLPEPRRAAVRRLRDASAVELDEALVLVFRSGASFTGEDVAELHLHGGQATVSAVLAALSEIDGLRLAEAGEFTRRALMNGCLDLAQVEGLADLIDAETEGQRRQAQRVLTGAVGRRAEFWRDSLIRAAALLEASIDFVDEDVPVDVTAEVQSRIAEVLQDLRLEAEGALVAERVRDGFEVAIVGSPNAGKSTLINALAGREAAITSEYAGTTRDVIEVRMDLSGIPVTLLDTAGLREGSDAVEKIGIARARERAESADLRVLLLSEFSEKLDLTSQPDDIRVIGKSDLRPGEGLRVSGLTGAGLDRLVDEIQSRLQPRIGRIGTITRERHRLAVRRALEALESAQVEIERGSGIEVAAEEIRSALRALDSLVGRVDVENILDEIFSSFCIGK
jgi:tRNA modification GTPase